MNFMIKFLPLILLGSCSAININLGYLDLLYELRSTNKIESLDNFEKTGFSFLRATQNKNQAIFILEDYSNGLSIWVGANKEKIYTFNGIIIDTDGLDRDFQFNSRAKIRQSLSEGTNFNGFVSLTNPKASYLMSNLSKISESSGVQKNGLFCSSFSKYKLEVSPINFITFIQVCYDEKGSPLHSLQQINPLEKHIALEYYFRY